MYLTYKLVGNIITVNGINYQRVSRFDDVYLSDGWVAVSTWKEGTKFYAYSDKELGLDWKGRQII